MRRINEIIIHCTATPANRDITVEQLRRYHVDHNRWADIGYHYVIYRDGSVHEGRPVETPGAHCLNHNANSIGIAYVGGLLPDGTTAADTRTDRQKTALENLIKSLLQRFPGAKVHSHRDFARKACPCFDATAEYSRLCKTIILLVASTLMLTSCHTYSRATDTASANLTAINKIRKLESTDTTSFHLAIILDSLSIAPLEPSTSASRLNAKRAVVTIGRNRAHYETMNDTVTTTAVETSMTENHIDSTVNQPPGALTISILTALCIIAAVIILIKSG